MYQLIAIYVYFIVDSHIHVHVVSLLHMTCINRNIQALNGTFIAIVVNKYDDVIKWKHFPRYWQFVLGNPQWPVNLSHKGQWRGALMFSLICAWINGLVNNREVCVLRRHRTHYGVAVMINLTLHIKQVNVSMRNRCDVALAP